MAIGLLILVTVLVAFVLGPVASLITEDEKEIYQKYFKYFLIALIVLIPVMYWFADLGSLFIVIFLFVLVLSWQYTDHIFRFFGIKRKKK